MTRVTQPVGIACYAFVILTALLAAGCSLPVRQSVPVPGTLAPPADPSVQLIGGPVKPPVLIRSVTPSITSAMRTARMSGNVEVNLVLDESGIPTEVHAVRSLGQDFDEAAVTAVRQYRFKPATRDGHPVKVSMYVNVSFKIF